MVGRHCRGQRRPPSPRARRRSPRRGLRGGWRESWAAASPVSSGVPRAPSSPPPGPCGGAAGSPAAGATRRGDGWKPAPFRSDLRLTGAPCPGPNRPGEGAQPAVTSPRPDRRLKAAAPGSGSGTDHGWEERRVRQPRGHLYSATGTSKRCARVPRRGGARTPRAAAWGL